jgi:signal transduction histidine kinase
MSRLPLTIEQSSARPPTTSQIQWLSVMWTRRRTAPSRTCSLRQELSIISSSRLQQQRADLYGRFLSRTHTPRWTASFWGAYRIARASLLNADGSLTLVSGFLSKRPSATAVLQGAINAALEGLVRGLALEFAPLRVNAVSPGVITENSVHARPASLRNCGFPSAGYRGDGLPMRVPGPRDRVEPTSRSAKGFCQGDRGGSWRRSPFTAPCRGLPMYGNVTDHELLRHAQADLAYVTRVTTMGELTASLAHEIKQPISAAVTDAQTCLRWLGPDQPDVAEAREAVLRVSLGLLSGEAAISAPRIWPVLQDHKLESQTRLRLHQHSRNSHRDGIVGLCASCFENGNDIENRSADRSLWEMRRRD